jgi:hypothetical protein
MDPQPSALESGLESWHPLLGEQVVDPRLLLA